MLKARFLNGVLTGGYSHTPKGGGCYEEIHIKNVIFYNFVYSIISDKSKITAPLP